MNDYEAERQKRIEANKLLLQNLGLGEKKKPQILSTKHVSTSSTRVTEPRASPFSYHCTSTHNEPVVLIPKIRRSARARGKKSYQETDDIKKETDSDYDPEFDFIAYLFESEGLTGASIRGRRRRTTSRPTRSVPGIRYQGGRVYDSVRGSTCHQCRQKTMDEKVRCTSITENGDRCNVLLDEMCLRNRYGLTLDEAQSSGDWVCPVCQGICNCSICRRRNGLPATGILAHVCERLGYSSAAELLESKRPRASI
ncbi:Cell division cycle-associated 7-like protein [Basidiobolus ranarum]|uniref:Cell division cycle-associated 7-like protein n=1 Tax=Basidiobolus ranarum TaxID=34480 RepID=A0ABR2W430_9FUNG